MFRFLLILLFLTALTGCQTDTEKPAGTKKVEQINEFRERERFYIDQESGERRGPYFRYSATDTLLEKANYSQGQLHGKRYLYFPNGRMQTEETYVDGAFEGPYATYFSNGQLELTGDYINNTMEGTWKRYYETGELFEEVTFANNQENGPFTEYYKNGSVQVKGTYLEGDHEHGELLFYDEDGTLTKKMNCDGGLCRTTWTIANGEPQR